MRPNTLWSTLFAVAIAVLMLSILMIRSEPTPLWVLLSYPAIGAALGNVASRTSPTSGGIARIETAMIAAAAVVPLAVLADAALVVSGTKGPDGYVVALIGLIAWWRLEGGVNRLRRRLELGEAPRPGAEIFRLGRSGKAAEPQPAHEEEVA